MPAQAPLRALGDPTHHPAWPPGPAEIAAKGGAGRRSAQGADAPLNQSRKRTTRRGRSTPPEGGISRTLAGVQPATPESRGLHAPERCGSRRSPRADCSARTVCAGATVVSDASTHRRRLLMDLRVKAWQLPPRLIAGAYFLNAGLSKRGADDATAGQLHGFASGTYPLLGKLDAKRFTSLLSTAEIAIGTALVVPVVPAWLAGGAALAGRRWADRLCPGHPRLVPADPRHATGGFA